MSAIRKQIRKNRFLHLAIYENPFSNVTAFLIHGLGGRGEQWRKQIDILKNHYTLIIPDMLGHGRSDKPCLDQINPYSFYELNQDLEILFSEYSSQENVIIGHSYGGAFSTSLAINHSDRIDKLVLIAPTPCIPNISIPFFYRMPVLMMNCLRPLMEMQFKHLAFNGNDQDLVAFEMKANHENPMYMIKQAVNGMRQMPFIDVTKLKIKSKIFVGMHDRLISPFLQQEFYKKLPYHEITVIDDGSHMMMLEQPEIINDKIKEYLFQT